MASKKQREASKRNIKKATRVVRKKRAAKKATRAIKKATRVARKKRTISKLPRRVRTALGKEGAKMRKKKSRMAD